MGIQGQSLQDLAECALLHDNAVAQYIQEELQNDALRNGVTKLGRHCTIGEKILKNIPFHNDVSNVILYPPMKTLMEDSFYNRKNLNPQIHDTEKRTMMEVPEGVDAELLAKVLSNPEMAVLLTSLAKSMQGEHN